MTKYLNVQALFKDLAFWLSECETRKEQKYDSEYKKCDEDHSHKMLEIADNTAADGNNKYYSRELHDISIGFNEVNITVDAEVET